MLPFPFDLDDTDAYQRWRADKLTAYPRYAQSVLVEIANERNISTDEFEEMAVCLRKTNMVVYSVATDRGGMGVDSVRTTAHAVAEHFGLKRLDANLGADEDGLSSLKVVEGVGPGSGEYIPYTDKALNWHTDGYYNEPHKMIHGMVLHCVRPAMEGGENALLDPEIAYIHLRDENPDWVEALMHPQALTSPANIQGSEVIRPERQTAVFVCAADGSLHMNYTERKRNIVWRDTPETHAAVAFLRDFMASDSPYIFRVTLQSGWGLVCNNVLHTRTPFVDDASSPRLILRGRYYDRVHV